MSMNKTTETTYAVWYASAGCLSDSGYPEFIGTMEECEAYIEENAHEYERPEVQHDLYSLSIGEYEVDLDDDDWM